jgi:hypothetical protein
MAHETVNITALELLGGHRVRMTFDDGAQRERDLSPLLTGPVFDAIRTNPTVFAKVHIDPELGVLCWPNGVDIDAELLRYDDLWDEAIGLTPSA